MAFAELSNERGSEHTLELGGIEGASVLSSSFEGVEGRIEISWLPSYA